MVGQYLARTTHGLSLEIGSFRFPDVETTLEFDFAPCRCFPTPPGGTLAVLFELSYPNLGLKKEPRTLTVDITVSELAIESFFPAEA